MDDRTAVLIFEENQLSREMRYSEFEAILDAYAPMPELANQQAQAVYLHIDNTLHVQAAVFFYIDFDSEGFADHRWNIPLQQLAENSSKGPDMGAGPIRLACRSQCCIEWHQKSLWDPQMGPKSLHFVSIKEAIKNNRLGFILEDTSSDSSSETQAGDLTPQVLAQANNDHRLRVAALTEEHEAALQALKVKFQTRLHEQRGLTEQLQHKLQLEQNKNREHKDTIEGQANKIQGIREYFENKLESAKLSRQESLDDLKKGYEVELEARISASIANLREDLQIKEVTLMYKETQCASLEEDVRRLQEEKQELLANSGNQLLERLYTSGINFVSFQPGYGHMTIPVDDIPTFMEDSLSYVAQKCGVNKSLYEAWLEHHSNPQCQAITSGGLACGKRVDRIERPSDFLLGESDRCDEHGGVRH